MNCNIALIIASSLLGATLVYLLDALWEPSSAIVATRNDDKEMTVRLSLDMHEWLKQEASAQSRSIGNLIQYILNIYRQEQNSSSSPSTMTKEAK